jgi:hypothetical protein
VISPIKGHKYQVGAYAPVTFHGVVYDIILQEKYFIFYDNEGPYLIMNKDEWYSTEWQEVISETK